MEIVIEFFRDTLDGPFYIVWVVVLVILIFACIGYLAEKGIKNKKEKEKYAIVNEENAESNAVVMEQLNEPVMEAASLNSDVNNVVPSVSNNTTPAVVSSNIAPVNNVNEVPQTVIEVTAAPVNNTVVVPDVVSQNFEPVATVVSTNPVQESVNNEVIPTINQDGNNKTV